tara:strand:+ start:939 stop:2537 length:1599 start_codon:yes stop_codon:yes gene_type:complete
MNLKNIFKSIEEALASKNYSGAKYILEQEIKNNPKNFELNFKLGLVNNILGELTEAINFYEKAILLEPNYSPAFCNLGIVYDKLNNKNLAIKNYKVAIEKDPKNFKAYYNLGNCYLKNNDIEHAEESYISSINLKPDNLHSYINLFQIYDRSNNLKKLDYILKSAKNKFDKNPIIDFFEGISQYRKNNFEKTIEIFEKLEIDARDTPKNIVKFNILAKCYDHSEMHDKAFKLFEITNKLMNNAYRNKFDKNKYIKLIDERTDFFSQTNFKKWESKIQNDGENDPIFLVGFPRSGTTLLDTILRTHSSVEVLEEKPLVDIIIEELHKHINKDFTKLSEIDQNIINKLRLIYFETRANYISTDNSKLYIDKLPLNIIHIGELNRIFPNAKYILALRNPYDSVLSCFMQPFTPNNAMSNFYNLNDASKLYDQVMQLWSYYDEKLDIETHVVKYEEVVKNFDVSISSLLSFLELDWNDKLKEFYKTSEKRGIIHTPSYNQINQPLYDKSIGRWKNYKKHFEATDLFLKRWSSKFNY